MKLADVTPLILTYNEAANLRATLGALSWAERIVVLDSGSTDATLVIAAEYPQVVVHRREFDNHTSQWNHGLGKVGSGWVLTLDADYVSPLGLPEELQRVDETADVYYANFRYCVFGYPLRSSLYPARAVLFRPASFRYVSDGHTQTLDVSEAKTQFLNSVLHHDDRKTLTRWCQSQLCYAKLEAEKLRASDCTTLTWKDRLRKKIVFAPGLTLLYCLFVKRLIIDGWPGIYYSLQRTFAELVLSLVLLDLKIRSKIRSVGRPNP